MRTPDKLNTRRLILRPLIGDDFDDFIRLLQDKFIKDYLQVESADIKSFFSSILHSSNEYFTLAIINRETENFLGICGLKNLLGNTNSECFYSILPLYRGYGFAIESMRELITYSFEDLYLRKIIIYLHPNNIRAWKVAERIGMKYMGQFLHKKIIPKAMLFTIEKKEYEVQRSY